MKFLYIALGGAIGALLRYAISGLPHRYFESVFPWGTLTVNLLGSFAIGFLWGAFERTTVSPNLKTFLFIGILGAFTTFSTYSIESINLLRDGEIKLALTNILISNVACIVLCFVGFISSRYLVNLFR
ncbi:MAG: fluoride efflux transporter CrcB [Chloroflexi bacterium]|nr:fluoride efflux transporter CrcB [Chloroflexota bacterium]